MSTADTFLSPIPIANLLFALPLKVKLGLSVPPDGANLYAVCIQPPDVGETDTFALYLSCPSIKPLFIVNVFESPFVEAGDVLFPQNIFVKYIPPSPALMD